MNNRRTIDVRTERHEQGHVLFPIGEIDLSSSPDLRVALREALADRPGRLVVNLAEAPYMDSSGVATLVEAMQIAIKQETRLVLCCMQDKVRSMFEIARLDLVFTIVEDQDAALSA